MSTCKGSWMLGTACGRCERCYEEARELIPKLLRRIDLPTYELHALADWHRDREYEAANKREYSEAESHKQRRAELSKIIDGPSA